MWWNGNMFSEMERLRGEMNNLFSNYGKGGGSATFPLVNVYNGKEDIVVTAELPGLSKDSVNITFTDGVLAISGTLGSLEKTKSMTAVRKERSEGDFEKTITIPTKIEADSINAAFKDGILTVTLPKAEEVKPRTIAIEAR